MERSIAVGVPGEFEQQAALVLGCDELLVHFPQVLVEMVSALIGRIPLIAIVDGEEHRRWAVALLADWGLDPNAIQFICMPGATMWVRDYGPSFVKTDKGQIVILDADYVPGVRPADDIVPTLLANLLDLPVLHAPLTIEGGNLLSNGRGLCLTTNTLVGTNASRGYDLRHVGQILGQYYAFRSWTYLKPLVCETTAHVDLFATFTSHDTIVLGQYDPRIDPVNARVLDENAAILSGLRTETGPLKVVRIPMPTNHGSIWRTYTNVIFANGTLLVPTYPDVEPDFRHILDLYARLLPGWDIVPVNTESLIHNRGSLRCVSINVPWLESKFRLAVEPARRVRPAAVSA